MTDPQDAPFTITGVLSEGVLPTLLRALYVGRHNGLLAFEGQEGGASVQRGVRFAQGHIVGASSNVKDERLGETLMRLGLLSAADFQRVSEAAVTQHKRLGLVFAELGLLDDERLAEGMAGQVREIVGKLMAWNGARYSFREEPLPFQEDITLKLSTGDLILQSVRAIHNAQVVRSALGDPERVLSASTDPLLRFQRISLTPTDGFLLSRIDGSLTAREILDLFPGDGDEACHSLLGLLCTGIVEFTGRATRSAAVPRPVKPAARQAQSAPPPAPENVAPPIPRPGAAPPPSAAATARQPRLSREELATLYDTAAGDMKDWMVSRQEVLEAFELVNHSDHFALLGVERSASMDEVKAAYILRAKRFHPDVHHEPGLADLRQKLEAIFRRLGEAIDALSDPERRQRYESGLAAPPKPAAPPSGADPAAAMQQAQTCIRRAERLIGEEQYWDAIKLLEGVEGMPCGALKQKARMLRAGAYLKNPLWTKRTEELLRTVIAEEPKHVEAHFMLGNIYKNVGLTRRAVSTYRRVLDLKPDHADAQAALDGLLSAAQAAGEGGSGGGG